MSTSLLAMSMPTDDSTYEVVVRVHSIVLCCTGRTMGRDSIVRAFPQPRQVLGDQPSSQVRSRLSAHTSSTTASPSGSHHGCVCIQDHDGRHEADRSSDTRLRRVVTFDALKARREVHTDCMSQASFAIESYMRTHVRRYMCCDITDVLRILLYARISIY